MPRAHWQSLAQLKGHSKLCMIGEKFEAPLYYNSRLLIKLTDTPRERLSYPNRAYWGTLSIDDDLHHEQKRKDCALQDTEADSC